jgi:hypothetical protein
MFNAGGEVTLFNRLGFNAVLWPSNFRRQDAKPNVHDHFSNQVEMNIGSFSASAEWKELIAMEKIKNNISHIDISFLPTDYSDY